MMTFVDADIGAWGVPRSGGVTLLLSLDEVDSE